MRKNGRYWRKKNKRWGTAILLPKLREDPDLQMVCEISLDRPPDPPDIESQTVSDA